MNVMLSSVSQDARVVIKNAMMEVELDQFIVAAPPAVCLVYWLVSTYGWYWFL